MDTILKMPVAGRKHQPAWAQLDMVDISMPLNQLTVSLQSISNRDGTSERKDTNLLSSLESQQLLNNSSNRLLYNSTKSIDQSRGSNPHQDGHSTNPLNSDMFHSQPEKEKNVADALKEKSIEKIDG